MRALTPQERPVHRLPNQIETLEAFEIMETAIETRRTVEVWFFKEAKDKRGNPRRFTGERFAMALFGKRPMLTSKPVRRMVEPIEMGWSLDGMPYVIVTVLDQSGREGIAVRTIRLDRVSVGPRGLRLRVTSRPCRIAGTALDPALKR
jgi:hypothetical protein